MKRVGAALILSALVGGMSLPVFAMDEAKDIVLVGDAKCTKCHDEADDPKVLAVGKTRHGVNADKRTPTCTSCHGESEDHIAKAGRGGEPAPKVEVGFNSKNPATAEQRNEKCLACHQGSKRINWQASAHAANDVACSSCHKIHDGHDTVQDKLAQTEVCFTCHTQQRAQLMRPSRHPVQEGKVTCSDCHNPHGSAGPKMVKRDTVIDTCYQCHAEKRGPFIWNHQPVTEDCSICHNPHGSVVESMLKVRAPMLCQQCHEPTSHRGVVPDMNGTSTDASRARGCLNCHTSIHGSNNPTNINTSRSFRR